MPILRRSERDGPLMDFLEDTGWKRSANGMWRHPNLLSSWTLEDAVRLQGEADTTTRTDDAVVHAVRALSQKEPKK